MNQTDRWKLTGILATVVMILTIPIYLWRVEHQAPYGIDARSEGDIAFVGSSKCAECHKTQYDLWKGSHHDMAMDQATEATVLGDFNDATFDHFGARSTFYKKGDSFRVRTQGPEGAMEDFEIRYVFGVYPLQQYLVPFPGGRLQCLPLAWDVPGKRWYHLYPEAPLSFNDWLYWTNAGQNWNGMCAECHSTNLQKNYDPDADAYQTTWSEIDVSCEACHGPGSEHVAWAEMPAMGRPQEHRNYELMVQTGGISARNQVELCAPCHSRRAILGDYTHYEKDLLDSMLPSLLLEGLYFNDGQILDEVYVYGSFTQSRMYHRDVRCSDCHDIHSLKTVKQGNELCLQCHRAAVYDTSTHHFHKREGEKGDPIMAKDGTVLFEVGSGAQCSECHMPARIYMGIDKRRDHSFRIPRPDLSMRQGTPNACNTCHWNKNARWSDDAATKWYGPGHAAHYGTIIAQGRKGLHENMDDLIRLTGDPLYPVIVRATAIGLLRNYSGQKIQAALETAMSDPEALIRQTAVSQVGLLEDPGKRRKLLSAMLYDPVKAVRIEAASQMAAIYKGDLAPTVEAAFQSALDEYRSAMGYSADFAFGRFNLGNLYWNLKDIESAIEQYRAALRIDDQFYMAAVNLAMLYNQKGDKSEAERLLRRALATRSDLYEVHYSLGLLLVEERKYEEAVRHLEAATRGMPDFARAFYNLGLLLDFLHYEYPAQQALERAYHLDNQTPEILQALVQFYLQHEKYDKIETLAQKLFSDDPNNPIAGELLKMVKDRSGNQKKTLP